MLHHLCCFDLNCPIGIILKTTKWPYLSHLTSNQENNYTLFSSTFKVEENKVSLVFGYQVKYLRYNHFVKLNWILPFGLLLKTTKWLYLIHLVSNQENKDTLLSSTLTDEENKVPLFCWFEVKYKRYSNFVVLT